MLLHPERDQARRQKAPESAQLVQPRMTGRAERDQVRALMHARPPVMDMGVRRLGTAALADATVALKNGITVPGKPPPGVLARPGAGSAQADPDGPGKTARAEEGVLIPTAHGQPVYRLRTGSLQDGL